MNENFYEQLDSTLQEALCENTDTAAEDLISIAKEIEHQITELEQSLQDSKKQLQHIIERLNSNLGMEIRKLQPKMSIGISGGACTCGYKSRDLKCVPDLGEGRWNIGGRLGRGFVKKNPHVTRLSSDVGQLANAIVSYFRNYYRTL